MLSGNNAKLRQIHSALATNAAKVASAAVVGAAPLVVPAAPAEPILRRGINLSNFSPNELATLGQVAQFMKTGKGSELEGSYAALNTAEKLGKRKKPASRKTTRRRTTRRGKRT